MATEPAAGAEPEGDYWVDEKSQQVYLSEAGHVNAEGILARLGILPEGESLYDPRHIALMHHLVALRATRCSSATSSTWSRTAKWSSSTNSPAA